MPDPDPPRSRGGALDTVLGGLNAVLGDHLARTGNALAIESGFYRDGVRLASPPAAGKVAVWLHGLGNTEAVFAYPGDPSRSYPALLEAELGYTPLTWRYNTGLPIADNGALFARALTGLPAVTELLLVGYSMGGLVLRSACHVAAEERLPWLPLVRRAIYLGVPHLGAPLERLGRVVTWTLRTVPNPVTRLIADVADLRSAGVKDLGRGRIVAEPAADATTPFENPHHPLPLLPGIEHHLVVGTISAAERTVLNALFGDGLVPMVSAGHGVGEVTVLPGVDHLALAHDDAVWRKLRAFVAEEGT